jgi:release factor H-coupled RctB family protein
MGNSVRIISDAVSVIASGKSWIEGRAIEQLQTTAMLKGMVRAVGLPDLHPGRGYPIGAAFFSQDHIYPALVGNDIGCGMSLWSTSIKSNKVNHDKFEKQLRDIEGPLDNRFDEHLASRKQALNLTDTLSDNSLGTIGGGNHFAELQQLDKVYDETLLAPLAISKKQLVLLAHSGSRGLGQAVLTEHVQQFGHKGLSLADEIEAYLDKHNHALRWAELNREMIALRMLQALGAKGDKILDVNHNLVEAVEIEGLTGWLHRKGATPADCGLVMIPGSRGDLSYLIKPKPASSSLYSLAHGAGRKWQRSECKDRLSERFSISQLEKTSLGSRVICKNKALMYEEAPQAYKAIDSVISDMLEADLIELVASFKPVLTFKTAGKCCG